MLLVITGAGASHDIRRGANGDRVPLAADLFAESYDQYLNEYPQAGALVTRLRSAVERGASVEAALQALRDESDSYPPLRKQLLAVQFYLHDLFYRKSELWASRHAGVNNYMALVGELERWNVKSGRGIVYLTFNYDTLLDTALARELGIAWGTISDYVSESRSLIKLHGSVGWGRHISLGSASEPVKPTAKELILLADDMTSLDTFEMVSGVAPTTDRRDRLITPALSVPVESKSDFSCPAEHQQHLIRKLPDIQDVLVIGWRGAEAHVRELLARHLNKEARLLAITRPVAAGSVEPGGTEMSCAKAGIEWPRAIGLKGQCRALATGFSGFVGSHLSEYVADLPT